MVSSALPCNPNKNNNENWQALIERKPSNSNIMVLVGEETAYLILEFEVTPHPLTGWGVLMSLISDWEILGDLQNNMMRKNKHQITIFDVTKASGGYEAALS